MLGSFALVGSIIPISAYQNFLETDGWWLLTFFSGIHTIAFGVLGVALMISISANYARLHTTHIAEILGAVVSALLTYTAFIGLFEGSFEISSLGAEGMFTALFSACTASALYCWLIQRKLFTFRSLYSIGADGNLNRTIVIALPILIVTVSAFLLNMFITNTFKVSGLEGLFNVGIESLFGMIDNNSIKSLLFVMITDILWFFGIHGSNVLENITQSMFYTPDGALLTTGFAYLNRTVLDVFVFIGGCGTTVSLLLAVLLFSRRKSNKNLGRMASVPMLFNINELMLFGLPVVFNPSLFIPFILVPLVCMVISLTALGFGLVPEPTETISWAMPIFVNAYKATGSVSGVILQMINITVGVLIYRWFLIRYERRNNTQARRNLNALVETLKRSEDKGEHVALLEMKGTLGSFANSLGQDLQYLLKSPDLFKMFYQPQYNEKGKCVGAEALFRWDHPLCGIVYPPIVISLAEQTGCIQQLEQLIFKIVARDVQVMHHRSVLPGKISVNVTAPTLQEDSFVTFLEELVLEFPEIRNHLCIELTEQTSIIMDDRVLSNLDTVRKMGYSFAIDDFSMGKTSVKYLQSDLFEYVKLDGSLVQNMNNKRSEDIVSSILQMGETMNFKVIAEYVETKEQKRILEELGCKLYQGWLYYPAIPLYEFLEMLDRERAHKRIA